MASHKEKDQDLRKEMALGIENGRDATHYYP